MSLTLQSFISLIVIAIANVISPVKTENKKEHWLRIALRTALVVQAIICVTCITLFKGL